LFETSAELTITFQFPFGFLQLGSQFGRIHLGHRQIQLGRLHRLDRLLTFEFFLVHGLPLRLNVAGFGSRLGLGQLGSGVTHLGLG
jgi:hypothetical protein